MFLVSRSSVTSFGNQCSYALGCTFIKMSPNRVIQGDTLRMYILYDFLLESYEETVILHAAMASTKYISKDQI